MQLNENSPLKRLALLRLRGNRRRNCRSSEYETFEVVLRKLHTDLQPFVPIISKMIALCGSDWGVIYDNEQLLLGVMETVSINRMIAVGKVPPGFTSSALCSNCGPVLVDVHTSGELVGCPWCHSSNKPEFVH